VFGVADGIKEVFPKGTYCGKKGFYFFRLKVEAGPFCVIFGYYGDNIGWSPVFCIHNRERRRWIVRVEKWRRI
jgi:hypothetical protein